MVAGSIVLVLGSYDGLLGRCLKSIKQDGHRALAQELVRVASQQILRTWGDLRGSRVAGVSSSRQGQRFRGFSLPAMMEQDLLAKSRCAPVEQAFYELLGETRESSRGMSPTERLSRYPKTAHEHPDREVRHDSPLILLDDVVTTGATLSHAVSVAQNIGYSKIRCFALAATSV